MLAILGTFSKTEYQHGGEAYCTMLMFLSRNEWQSIKDKLCNDTVGLAVLAYHHAILSRKESENILADFCVLCHPNETMDYLFMMSEQERLREAVRKARQLEELALGALYVAVYGCEPPSRYSPLPRTGFL